MDVTETGLLDGTPVGVDVGIDVGLAVGAVGIDVGT